jgi:hypothetical protein
VVYARSWASFSARTRRVEEPVVWCCVVVLEALGCGCGVSAEACISSWQDFQHVDVAGSREGWGSLRCLGALCLGSALVRASGWFVSWAVGVF